METAVHYDLGHKQLCFAMKEAVTTDPDVQLRFRGLLNTVTGGFEYRGVLRKQIFTGPALKGEGTQPLRVGAGVGISSGTRDEPFLSLSAKKRITLLEGPDTLLTAKALLDYHPRDGRMARRASLRLSRQFFQFTERQDLELAAGLDLDWPRGGAKTVGGNKPVPRPFLRIRENNWGLHLRNGRWQVTYDL